MSIRPLPATLAVLASPAAPARADLTMGATVSATGPAASLGMPERNTFALMPTASGERLEARGEAIR